MQKFLVWALNKTVGGTLCFEFANKFVGITQVIAPQVRIVLRNRIARVRFLFGN